MRKLSSLALLACSFSSGLATAGTDPRSTLFCDLATRYFAAFLPSSPARKLNNFTCQLGTIPTGQLEVYFPTLGTDSLERERIVTAALDQKIIDEPDLGEQAFSVVLPIARYDRDTPLYAVHYYARKYAQIYEFTFRQTRPFAPGHGAAARSAIKAFLAELD